MVIVTNAGSNLSAEQIARWNIALTPQQINVDGTLHETRDIKDLGVIDAWVMSAKTHPFVLGTSAAEFVMAFRELGRSSPDILAVMTSRKIIGSYDAALAAARTLVSFDGAKQLTLSVVDSGATDVATGLITLLCALSAAAGKSRAAIAKAAEKVAAAGAFVVAPTNPSYLAKGGRAHFLKLAEGDWSKSVPVVSFGDGELTNAGHLPRDASLHATLVDVALARLGDNRRRVWAAVGHGGDLDGANKLLAELHLKADVDYAFVRPLSPSIYLHFGPRALALGIYPTDVMPWPLPAP